ADTEGTAARRQAPRGGAKKDGLRSITEAEGRMAEGWLIVWVLAVIFLATLIRSAFGFGEALLAVPLLALLMPVEVAAPLAVLVSVTVAAVVVLEDWQQVQLGSAWRLVLSTLFGIPLGLLLTAGARPPRQGGPGRGPPRLLGVLPGAADAAGVARRPPGVAVRVRRGGAGRGLRNGRGCEQRCGRQAPWTATPKRSLRS